MRRIATWGTLALAAGGAHDCDTGFDVVPAHAASAERVYLETDDGAHVFLEHYAGPGASVVLCHGISSNHHFWNLAPGRSLALTLQEAGFDVWNMDLRGHGQARVHPDGRRQRPGWTVDDYGLHDLPAAFAHVQGANGGKKLHYVGHSMGGMVLAVYLATAAGELPLASAVTVGSPLDFRDPDALTGLLLANSWAGRATPFVPTPTGARWLGRLRAAPMHLDEFLFNPANLGATARELMYQRIVSPLSRGEIAQFGQMVHDGEFRPADGGQPYRERLGQVQLPMRFIAGRADRIAPPDRVWTYYESVGSPQKDFIVAGEANGFDGDYGHLDLGVGDLAEQEIFPLVVDWLKGHP